MMIGSTVTINPVFTPNEYKELRKKLDELNKEYSPYELKYTIDDERTLIETLFITVKPKLTQDELIKLEKMFRELSKKYMGRITIIETKSNDDLHREYNAQFGDSA